MANIIRRKWSSATTRENESVQGKRPPKSRGRRQDDFHRMLKTKIFTRSESKKTKSLHDVSNAAQSNLRSSNSPKSSKQQSNIDLPAALTRSTSAPMSITIHDNDFANSSTQCSTDTFIYTTLGDDEHIPNHEIVSSSDDRTSNITAHISTHDNLSAVTEASLAGQSHTSEVDADDQLDTSDSGSAPTQIISLSDNLSDVPAWVVGPTLTQTLSQVLDGLREMYGPYYQRTDDIAGIDPFLSTGRTVEYLSPHEMSTQLNIMSGHMIGKTSRILRGSIAPWLPEPFLYSEALDKAGSPVDKQTGLIRSYVSSWIFVSLAMSRVDGLRFIFTICLSFWICGADVSSLSIAKVAIATEQKWFKDNSNVSVQDRYFNKAALHSGYLAELQTDPNSTSSSKVPAVMSESDRSWNNRHILERTNVPVNLTTPIWRPPFNAHTSDEESIRDSTEADETEHPPSRVETRPDSLQEPTLESWKDEPSSGGVDLHEVEFYNMPDNKAGQTAQSSLPKSQSEEFQIRARSRSSNCSKTSGSQDSRRNPERYAGVLPCEDPNCGRTFANRSELVIHMDLRHQDNDPSDHVPLPTPLPRNQWGLLTPDESDFSIDERSSPDERRKKERSSLLRSERRRILPLDRKFRIRSGKEAAEFFVRGRVFAIVWHENSSPSSSIVLDTSKGSSPNLSVGSYGELVFSHIRRFVVIKAREGSCLALPIYIFNGYGSNENSLSEAERNRHSIIYDSQKSIERNSHDAFSTKESIAVEMAPGETLDDRSRLNFDMPQSVEWQTKVKDIGMVKGEQNLLNLMLFFRTELQKGEEEESIAKDNEDKPKANLDLEQDSSIARSELRSSPLASTAWA